MVGFILVTGLFGNYGLGYSQSLTEQISEAQSQGSVSSLSALATRIESLWPKDPDAYYKLQTQLGKALEPLAQTNSEATSVVNKQAHLVIRKSCPKNPDGAIVCFNSKVEIVERELRLSASAPTVSDAQLLTKVMGEMRSTMIPGYKRADVFMNVDPPLGSGSSQMGSFAGMDPNVITNCRAKAAYLKAIQENCLRNSTNTLQLHTLPESYHALRLYFLNYVKELIAKNPDARQQLNELMATARLNEEEQRELLEQLPK